MKNKMLKIDVGYNTIGRKPLKVHASEIGADMMQVALYAIAALMIAVTAFTLYAQFTSTNSTKDHITDIKMLDSGIYELFSTQGLRSYTSIKTSSVAPTGATPDHLKNGAFITNTWGGNITLAPAAPNTFTITDPAVPKKECINIVLGTYTNFLKVKVGAKTLTRATSATAPADAATGCAAATNTIVFTHG